MRRRRVFCSNFRWGVADVELEGRESDSHAAGAKNVRVRVAEERPIAPATRPCAPPATPAPAIGQWRLRQLMGVIHYLSWTKPLRGSCRVAIVGADPSYRIFERSDCDIMEALQRFHVAKELPMTVLRQRMTEDMQVRNLSPHTQASYLQQVLLFARHFGKSPDALTPEHIRTYQIYLTNEKKLALPVQYTSPLRHFASSTRSPSSGNGSSRMCFRFPRSRRNCPSF
jgi:hypothetical protein